MLDGGSRKRGAVGVGGSETNLECSLQLAAPYI